MEIRDVLPIGSVVILKNAEKKLMIFGIQQMDGIPGETPAEGAETYDYIGVLFPEGNLGPNFQYFFYHEDIEEVFFRGYENVERDDFIEGLTNYYAQLEQQEQEPQQHPESIEIQPGDQP